MAVGFKKSTQSLGRKSRQQESVVRLQTCTELRQARGRHTRSKNLIRRWDTAAALSDVPRIFDHAAAPNHSNRVRACSENAVQRSTFECLRHLRSRSSLSEVCMDLADVLRQPGAVLLTWLRKQSLVGPALPRSVADAAASASASASALELRIRQLATVPLGTSGISKAHAMIPPSQ